jgi:hypothetical protein
MNKRSGGERRDESRKQKEKRSFSIYKPVKQKSFPGAVFYK